MRIKITTGNQKNTTDKKKITTGNQKITTGEKKNTTDAPNLHHSVTRHPPLLTLVFTTVNAKLSYSGKLLGLKNFGGSDKEWVNSYLEIGNGGFIINASTSSNDYDVINNFGATGIDNWIFKAKEIILE